MLEQPLMYRKESRVLTTLQRADREGRDICRRVRRCVSATTLVTENKDARTLSEVVNEALDPCCRWAHRQHLVGVKETAKLTIGRHGAEYCEGRACLADSLACASRGTYCTCGRQCMADLLAETIAFACWPHDGVHGIGFRYYLLRVIFVEKLHFAPGCRRWRARQKRISAHISHDARQEEATNAEQV